MHHTDYLSGMPGISPEDAATLPTVLATVDAAFTHAAYVRPGDRVLVHAATGGVGLAAVQILQVNLPRDKSKQTK